MGVSVSGPPVLLLQVEVAEADGEAGVVGLAAQGRRAHRGEGAEAQAIWRNNFAVCKGKVEVGGGEETETRRGSILKDVSLRCALIINPSRSLQR